MIKTYQISKEKITFDEERHIFRNEKGEVIPGVTGVISILDKSAALTGWAVRLAKEYLISKIDAGEQITIIDIEEAVKQHRIKKEEAGNIGEKIHTWIEEWMAGKNPAMAEDEKVRNGITAFLQFQKENKVKWLENTKVIYSKKYGFAGILDAVGRIGKDLVLVDFKSSNAIYQDYALQCAGYQIAYEEEKKKKMKYRLVIRFGKDDGTFEWQKFQDNETDKKAFLACLALKQWLNDKNKRPRSTR